MHVLDRHTNLPLLRWLLHSAGLLSLLATAGAFHVAATRWFDQPRLAQGREAARLATLLETSGEVLQAHRRVSTELADLERNAQAIRDRIPDQPREAEFLSEATQAAEQVGLRVLNYQRQGVIVTPTHSQFDIRLNCHGTYGSICEFLDRLGRLSRVAVVKKLDILAQNSPEHYPLDLTLTLYYHTAALAAPVR